MNYIVAYQNSLGFERGVFNYNLVEHDIPERLSRDIKAVRRYVASLSGSDESLIVLCVPKAGFKNLVSGLNSKKIFPECR